MQLTNKKAAISIAFFSDHNTFRFLIAPFEYHLYFKRYLKENYKNVYYNGQVLLNCLRITQDANFKGIK